MRAKVLMLGALLCAPVLPAQSDYDSFLQDFHKYLDHNDMTNMGRLFKKRQAEVMRHFRDLCLMYRRDPQDALATKIEVMKEAWLEGVKTQTLEEYSRHISGRTDRNHQLVLATQGSEGQVYRLYEDGKKSGDPDTYRSAAKGAENLANAYQQSGHVLFAAKMWALAAEIAHATPKKTREDRENAARFIRSFLAQRERWEWTTDNIYTQNKAWAHALFRELETETEVAAEREADGYDANATGADALVMPDATEEVAELSFKVMAKEQDSPFCLAGGTPALWLQAEVRGPGPTKIPFFSSASLYLVRPAANKFGVSAEAEVDLEKNPWQPIQPASRFKASEFFLGPDKTKPVALWFYSAGEQESVYGVQQNLAPQPEYATLFLRNAGSWVGSIADEKVTFFDDNVNGTLFEENPYAYGMTDKTQSAGGDGARMPFYDSMKIGSGPVVPLSSYAKIGDEWFHLRGHEEGSKVGARPVNPKYFKLGAAKLKFKGGKGKPEVMVIEGVGNLVGARFDLAASKEVELPAGSYRLSFGRIASGKGARRMEAQVYPGSMGEFEVTEGETFELSLGAPFKLDFVRKGDGRAVIVDAQDIAVIGKAGERYSRINGATPTPEVLGARTEAGKGAKPIGSFVAMDADTLNVIANKYPAFGAQVGFFAMPKDGKEGSLALEATLPYDGGFVGLRDKKNKLFGKLESAFK